MSTDATARTSEVKNTSADPKTADASADGKGKGKASVAHEDERMEDEDEEEEEEEDDDDDDDDDEDMDVEESLEEIDPTSIVGRRTRGKKVDYTSPEALAKAGLKKEELEDDEEEVKMKDN
ncbi:hypothetical protein E1B28_000414 [Marasmius oreades]|uniref:Histone chaperone domain-containing protein n=1 Tax=Marasmius oreades TaxID=181124 RepID=A0A9P7V185_9AGAR|nr:uncharacterized protein E1B28_000414 [Marasmius oreades]KAG7098470.1 hypothetical protein E1B28_000414 [Marasmius oreades]